MYQQKKLDVEGKKAFCNLIPDYKRSEIEPLFAADNETAFDMNSIFAAVSYAKQNNADISLERAVTKPFEYKDKAELAQLLNSTIQTLNAFKDYLNERLQIKQKILDQVKPHISIENFKTSRNFDVKDYIDLSQNYPDDLPAAQMIKEAAQFVKKNDSYLEKKHKSVFSKYNIKIVPPTEYLSYGKNRSLSVRFNENTDFSLIDFNQVGYFAPNYHPSYESKTTFINEMCVYGKAKEAAIALNYGADPFLKNEFALGKKNGLPFSGMFRRDARNNYRSSAEFMREVARNLNQGKQQVLENIWKSLGQDLRSIPEIASIIQETNKIYNSRDFNGKQQAPSEAEKTIQLRQEEAASKIKAYKSQENNCEHSNEPSPVKEKSEISNQPSPVAKEIERVKAKLNNNKPKTKMKTLKGDLSSLAALLGNNGKLK